MSFNHYQILGVESDANADEIKAAYRRAAQSLHPDKNPEADPSQYLAVQEAYAVLSDPESRRRYDTGLPPDGGAVEGMAKRVVADACMAILTTVVNETGDNGRAACGEVIVGAIRGLINDKRKAAVQNELQCLKVIAELQRIKPIVRHGGEGGNLFAIATEAAENKAADDLRKIKGEIEVLGVAGRMAMDYRAVEAITSEPRSISAFWPNAWMSEA